jgi:hypothetical protein
MLKLDVCIISHGVNIEPRTKRINCHGVAAGFRIAGMSIPMGSFAGHHGHLPVGFI